MSNYVITISREYGSGGRTIARMLSEKLNIPYYDRDIIPLTSEDSGVKQELFGRVDEYQNAKGRLFKKNSVYTGEVLSPDDKDFTSDENLFSLQAQTIKTLAGKESCVIVGRCADFILKDYANVAHVLIYAPWNFRMEKASEKLGGSEKEVEKFLLKDDKRKEAFYRRFTGREWQDVRNFDLCINSEKLGFERCVDLIVQYIEDAGLNL